MAIVVAVVLLVGMVGLGVFFFYRSLPSTGTTMNANAAEASASEEQPEDAGALHIRAVSGSSNVHVREPGGDVLLDQELEPGRSVTYSSADQGLEVTVEDPDAVEVLVHGERQDIAGQDPEYSFTVEG